MHTAKEAAQRAGHVSRRLRKAGHTILYSSDGRHQGVYVTGNAACWDVTVTVDLELEGMRKRAAEAIGGTLRELGYSFTEHEGPGTIWMRIELPDTQITKGADQ